MLVCCLADLAVRAIAVAAAIDALPAPPALHVELLIEPAPCGPAVTLAGCNVVITLKFENKYGSVLCTGVVQHF